MGILAMVLFPYSNCISLVLAEHEGQVGCILFGCQSSNAFRWIGSRWKMGNAKSVAGRTYSKDAISKCK